MKQFKIDQEVYKKFRKKWFILGIPLVSAVVAVVIVVNTLSRNNDYQSLLFALPIMAILIGFSMRRSLKRQKQLVLSYSISISDSEILREQANTPPLSISFMEIKEILKTEKGNFMIKGRTKQDVIHIPYLIEDPATLEQHLAALAPITVKPRDPFYKKYGAVITILYLGAMLTVYVADNKIIVGICGTLVTAALIWSFYRIRISKNVPENSKRRSWLLLLVTAAIIYITYIKLAGPLL
jgi:hypothetical protein